MICKRYISMKNACLVMMSLHTSMLGLSLRYSRTRPGAMFLASTAVLMCEVVKLIVCILFVFFEEGKSISKLKSAVMSQIVKQPVDTMKVGIPSLLYVIQNNLLYTSASNLDAATYQVTYQLKILTTAFFTVFVLKRPLLAIQWLSLVIFLVGIVLVQSADADSNGSHKNISLKQNRFLGFSAVLGACTLSSFAGVYFEKLLKGSDVSVWMRNIQLSFLSIPLGLLTAVVSDYSALWQNGFFYGYDGFVIYVIILQAFGGMVVAMVVKHADNILKGFATSIGIIIICVVSVYLFEFLMTTQFLFGVVLVISSIFMYNYNSAITYVQKPHVIHKYSLV